MRVYSDIRGEISVAYVRRVRMRSRVALTTATSALEDSISLGINMYMYNNYMYTLPCLRRLPEQQLSDRLLYEKSSRTMLAGSWSTRKLQHAISYIYTLLASYSYIQELRSIYMNMYLRLLYKTSVLAGGYI